MEVRGGKGRGGKGREGRGFKGVKVWQGRSPVEV